MKDRIAKLIDVKTIITFAIVGAVVFLGFTGKVDSNKMYELALIIVGFYFGAQNIKKSIDGKGE